MVRLDITQEELLSVLSNLDAETLFQKLESVKHPKAEGQHKESKSIKKNVISGILGGLLIGKQENQ